MLRWWERQQVDWAEQLKEPPGTSSSSMCAGVWADAVTCSKFISCRQDVMLQKNNAHMTLTRRAAVRIGRVESTSSVECGRAGETGGFILKPSNEHDGVLVLQDGTAKRAQGKPHRLASEGWVRARHSCSAACIPARHTEHRESGRGRAARRLQQMSSAVAPSAQLTTPPAPLPSTKIR